MRWHGYMFARPCVGKLVVACNQVASLVRLSRVCCSIAGPDPKP